MGRGYVRIALMSDIHGNLAGLRAVMAALGGESPVDEVVIAGDHLWGGARAVDVWRLLAESGWKLVRGNADENLVTSTLDADFPPTSRYRSAALRHRTWLRDRLSAQDLQALAALPPEHRIDTPAGDLLVVHSSPRSTRDQCGGPHNTPAEATAGYSGTGATAIAFGHWHGSFVRPMPFGLLVNVASVGLPVDGQPLAAYTMMIATPGNWVVEQRRVPYDPEEELAAARSMGLPAWVPDDVPMRDDLPT